MLTSDALFDGHLILRQEERGYRFSLDAVLLAGLTTVRPRDRVADLGTGCGVVPLIMAHRRVGKSFVGVEIQPELAALARKNVELNGLSEKVQVREGDFRQIHALLQPESFDLVVSNPPYRRLESGRVNPDRQRALARHELSASVADVFAAGKTLLVQGGRLAVIYPAARLGHLMRVAQEYGFSPKDLTVIHSEPSGPACLVYLQSVRGGGEELRIAPPFFIHDEDGSTTEAMRKLYEGGGSSRKETDSCSHPDTVSASPAIRNRERCAREE